MKISRCFLTHLSVGVLDGRYIALAECALYETEHQRALAHATGSKDHHPVVVALLRGSACHLILLFRHLFRLDSEMEWWLLLGIGG